MHGTAQTSGLQPGFTLLELMVVLTISAMLLLVVAPRFAAILPGVEFKRESARLASTLKLARVHAIETQSSVKVKIDARNRSYEVLGTNMSGQFPATVEIFENGLNVSNARDPVRFVTFFANGTATDAVLDLKQAKTLLTLRVEWLNGGVSIDAPG